MSLIKINSMRTEQGLKLCLERLDSMMLLLIANVQAYPLDLRFTYRECRETSLPPKPSCGLPFPPA
jgi:hypothetical protein